jgi:hypothetical protein
LKVKKIFTLCFVAAVMLRPSWPDVAFGALPTLRWVSTAQLPS